MPERRKRLASALGRRSVQVAIFLIAASSVVVLGFAGFSSQSSPGGVLDRAYRTLQLFALESGDADGEPVPWTLGVARFMAPLVALVAAAELFRQVLEYIREGGLQADRDGHVVVCGLGQAGTAVVEKLTEECGSEGVVAVTLDPTASGVATARDLGVRVIVGDATSSGVLARADVSRARAVVALAGDDTTNAEIALSANSAECAEILMGVRDRRLADELHKAFRKEQSIRIVNIPRDLASAAVDQSPDGAKGVLIVGFGTLGQEIAVTIARRSKDVEIIAVDRTADRKASALSADVPATQNRLRGHSYDFVSPEFETMSFVPSDIRIGAAFVTVDDDGLGLTLALQLVSTFPRATVAVRMSTTARGLGKLMDDDARRPESLKIFGPRDIASRLVDELKPART